MKKGITAVSAAIMIAIIAMFVGTISITSYNSIQNAKKLVFAIEISEIQEEVTKYYDNSQDGTYPTTENEYTVNLSDLTSSALTQFDYETKTTDNELTVYEIDLTAIGITDTTYGNLKTQKDVYVVSKETGIVYYLEGVKAGSKTYYTRTQDLIDIKERNEKEEEEPENVSAPVISSDGIITKTLASGEEESYLANIKVKGKNIKTIKYEIGIISSDIAKEYFKSNGASIASDRLKLKDKEHVTLYAENENGDYTVKYYYYGYPKIPTGFVASIYEGETTIEDGLVIYETDSLEGIDKETAMTTYNQYVWIPVTDESKFIRIISWSADGFAPLSDSLQYVEPLTSTTKYVSNISLYSEEITQYNAMHASVLKNKGFFVGRYEAGYPQGKTVTNVVHDGTDKPVSKKGVEAWRNIDWDEVYEWTMSQGTAWVSNGAQYGVDTNPGVALVAKKTYENSPYVKSHLLYGIEWDAIMTFISKKYPQIPDDSTNKYGNSSGSVLPTGFYPINNIYDLAGNLWEWTYETYYGRSAIYSYTGIGWRVLRGGGTSSNPGVMGSSAKAGTRYGENPNNNYQMYGFRVALYLI